MIRYIVILFLLFPLLLSAQNTMYFMDNVPQSISYNPAFFPKADFFIGVPALSGASAQVYNSAFSYNDLNDFKNNISNPGFNAGDFLNSFGTENELLAEAKISLLSFGFRIRDKSFLSFSIDANSNIVSKSPTDIMYLFVNLDDIPAENFPVQVNNVSMLTTNFMRFGATYSYKVNENLTLGISPKINFNDFAIETDNFSYDVERESDGNFKKSVSGNFLMGLFTEMNPEIVNKGDVVFDDNFKLMPDRWQDEFGPGNLFTNKSFTVDAGATYAFEKWIFSASLLNLGTSVFKSKNYSVQGNEEYINVKELDKTKFTIPAKVLVGAVHQFSPKWNYGILMNNTFYKNNYTPSATVSLNGYIGKWLSTSASYTAGFRFDNLGVGLRLRFLPGTDLYFVTDNIIQAFNYKNAQRLTAAAGINLLFGMKSGESNNPEVNDSL